MTAKLSIRQAALQVLTERGEVPAPSCAQPVTQPSARSVPPSSTIDNHGEDDARLIFLVETRKPPCNANCVDC